MLEAGTSRRLRTAIGHGTLGLPRTLGCRDHPGSQPPKPKRRRPPSESSSAWSPRQKPPHRSDVNCPCATSAAGRGGRSPDAGERLGEPVSGGEVSVGGCRSGRGGQSKRPPHGLMVYGDDCPSGPRGGCCLCSRAGVCSVAAGFSARSDSTAAAVSLYCVSSGAQVSEGAAKTVACRAKRSCTDEAPHPTTVNRDPAGRS